MRVSSRLFRLSLWLATTSLTLSTAMPALAQPAPPPGAALSGNDNADPPAIAGRVARITGSVSFHASGEDHWNAASLNYPVTTGEAFWTEAQAQSELQVADDRIVMAGSTELDVAALDQQQVNLTEPQGAVFIELGTAQQGQAITVNTPRGAVQLAGPGRFEIVAGDTNDATIVTVVEGSAHVTGTGLELDVAANSTASIGGTDTFQGSTGPLQQDDFLAAQLKAASQQVASAPPQVRQQVQYMTGGAELSQYGSWSQTQDYGQVWYPNDVPSGWAPYRDGHWAYVSPWGWTWVDNASWGFAPFHYGRWVQVQDRWAWIAGAPDAPVDDYPVYSPAMVSFVDVGGAVLAGAAIGFAVGELAGGGAPAWIPLGPREPYYPWYHARPDYFARINGRYGVPRDIIQRGPTYINNVNVKQTNVFINQRAATVMPAAALARGEGVRQAGRPLPATALTGARPVRGRLPVVPTASTPNLTPAAARRYNVSLPASARGPRAPGPQIVPHETNRAAPVLRQAALPANVHALPAGQVHGGPAQAPRPGAAPGQVPPANRPNALAQPSLRQPNAGRPATPAIEAQPGLANRTRPNAPSQTPGNHPGPDRATPTPAQPARPEAGTPARPEGMNRPLQAKPGPSRTPEPHVAAPGTATHPVSPVRQTPTRPAEPSIAPRPAPVEHHQPAAPRPAPAPRPVEHAPPPRPQMARPAAPAFHPPAPRPAPPPMPHPAAPHPSAAPHPAPGGHGEPPKR